ncbi:MAG TPA: diacylglycerol kinase family protein [Nevskiaceae bacterium]|nr:diacylglycerol kinase family protein [Nevskiaceae bacterium]
MNAAVPDSAAATAPVTAAPACLIVNPRSFRASNNDLAERAATLARAHGAEVVNAFHPTQLERELDRQIAVGQEKVFVLAGDGTVHAIVDHLARKPAGTRIPRLLVLGGGRTNLIASDFDGRGRLLAKLERALQRARRQEPFRIDVRPTLVVEQAPAPPRHGFFVAAGLIDTLIREAHRHREGGEGALREGHFSTPWSLLKLFVRTVLGRGGPAVPHLRVTATGAENLREPARVLVASTLEHREGLLHPYAPRGEGPLRYTVVGESAPFWRRLVRLLTGRYSAAMTPQNGYLSGRGERLEVLDLPGYTLDGEKFDADPTRPVVFRTGPRIEFLLP